MAFLFGVLLGIALGYVIITLIARSRQNRYMAVAEYWVYLPEERLPKQDDIMSLVLQGNSPVGHAEGLLFSDIRLHIALILRSKNPHVFRPDLFADYIEPTPEILAALAESKAVAKVRYLSEVRLKSDAHLQLLPYLAYAYCKLANGKAIFDVTAEKLLSVPDLFALLKQDKNAKRPEVHLHTIWTQQEEGGRVETRGLVKKGLPELVTASIESDERMLVTNLIDEAAKKLWTEESMPEQIEVESYDDRFQILLGKPEKGRSTVRIMRVQAV